MKNKKKRGKTKCKGCGTQENVTYDSCPYASDVHGDNTKIHLCDTCRRNRADDI